MLALSCNITLGSLQVSAAASVRIEDGWRMLGGRATVVLPRTISSRRDVDIRNLAAIGSGCSIQLGYNGQLEQEFQGTIAQVKPGFPITFDLEDAFYKLRRGTVTNSWSSTTLAELLAFIAPGIPISCPDIKLGAYRIAQATPARVLAELVNQYGIYSWFRDGKLVSGFALDNATNGQPITVDLQGNVADASSLAFDDPEQKRLRIKAVSLNPDGSVVTKEFGPEDGETRTLHFYNLDSAALEPAARAEASRLNTGGYSGHVSMFGSPAGKHGQVARIIDRLYPEREGAYFIDKTVVEFGAAGFRRQLHLGRRAQ